MARPTDTREDRAVPTAVIRVTIDPDGAMSEEQYRRGVERLVGQGIELVGSDRDWETRTGRAVRILAQINDADTATSIERCCANAFGTATELGEITYISRGTDVDAMGVLARFGVDGVVGRTTDQYDEEVVTVAVPAEYKRRVPESSLRTALEAALNCDTRITWE